MDFILLTGCIEPFLSPISIVTVVALSRLYSVSGSSHNIKSLYTYYAEVILDSNRKIH